MGSCKAVATIVGALVVSLAGANLAWAGSEKEAVATTKVKDAPVSSVSQEELEKPIFQEQAPLLQVEHD